MIIQSIDWEVLQNLVHVDLSLVVPNDEDLDFRQSLNGQCPSIRLASLSKNLQYLSLDDIVVNTDGLSIDFEGDIRFPALKCLRFIPSDQGVAGSNTFAFEYFCAKSPKLEEIAFNGINCNNNEIEERLLQNQVSLKSIAKSIGQLDKRASLRKLTLENWEHTTESDNSIMRLFKCFDKIEKIYLEELSLFHENLPFADLLRFVDGNYKLKKLELGHNDITPEDMSDLLKIINCDNAIEELNLENCYWPEDMPGDRNSAFNLKRHQFPKFIEELKMLAEF